MADFKTEFFNVEKLRNQVMNRIGDYLKLPAKLDAMDAVVKRMTSARANDFRIVLPSLRTRVNAKINESLSLKDQLFAYTDKVQADPEVAKVIKGDVGMAEFALNAIFGKKTDLNAYKGYLAEGVNLSKKASKTIKEMEILTSEINNVETAIKNNTIVEPPPPVEEPQTWQSRGAMLVAGGVLAALAAHSWWKSRRK